MIIIFDEIALINGDVELIHIPLNKNTKRVTFSTPLKDKGLIM